MFTSYYDDFSFITNDPAFANSIAQGQSEPYPYDIHIVRKYLNTFPERCQTYIDVGAHIGTTIAPYSRIFKNIVGFEANPQTFEFLTKNIKNNNIDCRLEPFGLHERPCKGHIKRHSDANSGCFYFCEDEEGQIECKTLDQYEFEDVDFIKIDTEGSELYVLKGAEHTIKKYKPLIQVECNSLSSSIFGIETTSLVDYLQSLGYVLYNTGQANLFFYHPRIE